MHFCLLLFMTLVVEEGNKFYLHIYKLNILIKYKLYRIFSSKLFRIFETVIIINDYIFFVKSVLIYLTIDMMFIISKNICLLHDHLATYSCHIFIPIITYHFLYVSILKYIIFF